MTKGERRAQVERAKARAVRIMAGWCQADTTPANVGRLARTRHPCSCYACGNPRRHFGHTTLQERRQGVGTGGYWS